VRGREKIPHATIPVFVPHLGCPHRCSFCSQGVISGVERAPTPQEAAERCRRGLEELPARFSKAELAFFGGSFTALPQEEMEALLLGVQPLRDHPRFGGIRISTRPDAVGEETLKILRDYGVRAIELGAQSLYNEVLEANGRGHTGEEVRRAAWRIREAGFSLGLQMMTGLYKSSPELDWGTGLGLAELGPETVRIYPTVVLPGTQLARLYKAGDYSPPGLPETVELCARLLELFEGRGIRVIRLGLHSEEGLSEKALAGCFHPALGELCRGLLLRQRVARQLEEKQPEGPPVVLVKPRLLSQALGQRREGLLALQERWPGLVIRPEKGLEEDFRIG
jgi:histone acetyltransferase (RNA polymerase elongator complex component)